MRVTREKAGAQCTLDSFLPLLRSCPVPTLLAASCCEAGQRVGFVLRNVMSYWETIIPILLGTPPGNHPREWRVQNGPSSGLILSGMDGQSTWATGCCDPRLFHASGPKNSWESLNHEHGVDREMAFHRQERCWYGH